MKITNLAPVIQTPEFQPQLTAADELALANSRFAQSDLPFYRKLGRTNLTVSCLGLGGGGHISSEDTLYAFDQGINYFFYSSDLHQYLYSSMRPALRQLCGRGSSIREKVVLATVSYMIRTPDTVFTYLFDQFIDLGIDYIDVFFWGWIDEHNHPAFEKCISASDDIRGPSSVTQRQIERVFGVSEKMKKMGVVRYIGASFHDHDLAKQWVNSPLLDVVMVRHNVAHRTAQKKVFPHLDANDPHRPGIVTFKSAGMFGPLWEPPLGLPDNCWQPSVPDLYRYSLSQNSVDVALAGWQTREHVDAAIQAVQKGKLTSEEIDYLNLYGDLHRNRIKPHEIPTERLLVAR
ncbi:aldo/keto reductase family oxidoreductase [Tolypothrix tenuis PCC 7101]|uniref:Aldo/keto reductase family oxidoreductase n=1 Tax=Tolypothrix tenuis PCC 7101 TaxID=231146 RepID=A0A1Z4N5S1_9CYAN|nr:aldo/keto reductase [Aulosira sp. FACHB-113]BAZ01083.1 aldo/keto reductase family oxidoreductase [Tolypothrix tenuis PCC 7101]BAZ74995.1 aldo/keto reductase family oxidoreductase [Aulosira laxa NIES-50]